jgi:hypothetical protein
MTQHSSGDCATKNNDNKASLPYFKHKQATKLIQECFTNLPYR